MMGRQKNIIPNILTIIILVMNSLHSENHSYELRCFLSPWNTSDVFLVPLLSSRFHCSDLYHFVVNLSKIQDPVITFASAFSLRQLSESFVQCLQVEDELKQRKKKASIGEIKRHIDWSFLKVCSVCIFWLYRLTTSLFTLVISSHLQSHVYNIYI